MIRTIALVAAAASLCAAAPPPAALALNCYVAQSGDLSIGQFVRHLDFFPDRGIVAIADGMHGGAPQFVGNGKLVTFDAKHIVFDFASPRSAGRTEIDRATGALMYQGDHALVRGSCQASEL